MRSAPSGLLLAGLCWLGCGSPGLDFAAPEIWRSIKVGDAWQAPEKVIAPFAGVPTFDTDGNLYFTHHFWDDATESIIEADIYVCPRRG